jgi:hypothetical protein
MALAVAPHGGVRVADPTIPLKQALASFEDVIWFLEKKDVVYVPMPLS